MTHPNQYTSDKAVSAKAKTTEALKGEMVGKSVQEPIPMSSEVSASIRETLFKAENRKTVVEGIILAFQAELKDLNRVIEASEASLAILEEKNRPVLTAIDGGQE